MLLKNNKFNQETRKIKNLKVRTEINYIGKQQNKQIAHRQNAGYFFKRLVKTPPGKPD